MKKKVIVRLTAGLAALFCVFGAAGCAAAGIPSDPKDAIIDKYGNTQFKITFDSKDLASPLSDMYYSANSMPVLCNIGRQGSPDTGKAHENRVFHADRLFFGT